MVKYDIIKQIISEKNEISEKYSKLLMKLNQKNEENIALSKEISKLKKEVLKLTKKNKELIDNIDAITADRDLILQEFELLE